MPEVTVYTTPSCPWCNRLKDFLRARGVAFAEVDVSRDPAAARRLVELTGERSVPVTIAGGHTIVGFDREELERLFPA
ncbi:MAG: NrdH-redoxin [Firmicutes bacterium]|nr:NrdH-redoxin [Bacillota bacterium]